MNLFQLIQTGKMSGRQEEKPEKRRDPRLSNHFPIELESCGEVSRITVPLKARVLNVFLKRMEPAEAKLMDDRVVVSDLSRGGMCVESPSLLRMGEEVLFNFVLPNGECLSGTAQVKWREPLGFKNVHGLEFTEMSFIQKQKLMEYLFPRQLGVLKVADTAFQCAFFVILVLLLRDFMTSETLFRVFSSDYLPLFLMMGMAGSVVSLLLFNHIKS